MLTREEAIKILQVSVCEHGHALGTRDFCEDCRIQIIALLKQPEHPKEDNFSLKKIQEYMKDCNKIMGNYFKDKPPINGPQQPEQPKENITISNTHICQHGILTHCYCEKCDEQYKKIIALLEHEKDEQLKETIDYEKLHAAEMPPTPGGVVLPIQACSQDSRETQESIKCEKQYKKINDEMSPEELQNFRYWKLNIANRNKDEFNLMVEAQSYVKSTRKIVQISTTFDNDSHNGLILHALTDDGKIFHYKHIYDADYRWEELTDIPQDLI